MQTNTAVSFLTKYNLSDYQRINKHQMHELTPHFSHSPFSPLALVPPPAQQGTRQRIIMSLLSPSLLNEIQVSKQKGVMADFSPFFQQKAKEMLSEDENYTLVSSQIICITLGAQILNLFVSAVYCLGQERNTFSMSTLDWVKNSLQVEAELLVQKWAALKTKQKPL